LCLDVYLRAVTRAINGGTNGINDRKALLSLAKDALYVNPT